MKDLTNLNDLIAVVCDGDRHLGRWVTIEDMLVIAAEAEKEKSA